MNRTVCDRFAYCQLYTRAASHTETDSVYEAKKKTTSATAAAVAFKFKIREIQPIAGFGLHNVCKRIRHDKRYDTVHSHINCPNTAFVNNENGKTGEFSLVYRFTIQISILYLFSKQVSIAHWRLVIAKIGVVCDMRAASGASV